ncbi:hypothetical protein [Spirosoma oryzae]|nr:hypothetical protein [Spirosoma oryzae]
MYCLQDDARAMPLRPTEQLREQLPAEPAGRVHESDRRTSVESIP